MKSHEIREKFFTFFTQRGHTEVASSSLIPAQDPTLLFTNAGMNQFKDVFLGHEKRSYTRAVSIQKCIRAGGKHNDLENVGFTKRHLTFFEMMGNFSFGDYFKKEAIRFAWDFLTQEMQIPAESLYASVFIQDDEAYDLWRTEIGLPPQRIVRLGVADNFWQMGDTGPCGPCSEIYVDRGPGYGCNDTLCAPGCHCDRFLEVWNLVFMQYNRQPDGTDVPLEHKGVDTGMGLERLCALIQNKDSVYDTDLFAPVIAAIERETGHEYARQTGMIRAAFRVLADHIRSSAFAIADGCMPSNEGRGYVLRKIIRRAALFAQRLSDKNFFPRLVKPLVDFMGPIYPELRTYQATIEKVLTSEIEKFVHNLAAGKLIFEKFLREPELAKSKTITGAQAFKLYDTFGFPLELTKVLAHEHGLTVDVKGFDSEMEKQRAQSGKKIAGGAMAVLPESLSTEFVGYHQQDIETTISALMQGSMLLDVLAAGEQGWVITEKSPFFVECGGQVSDKGTIVVKGVAVTLGKVKKIDNAIASEIEAPVDLHVGDTVELTVDKNTRANTMKNHTATHLLQAALIELLGNNVRQSGSLVNPDYLRFDFTYHENLTPEQIKLVEDRVNAKIMENIPVSIYTTDYKTALTRGVIAIFGEKYNPESVRVIDIPGFSKELCGGTHVAATGDIGCFKITEVTSLSAGNRRIFALTGPRAVELFQESYSLLKSLSNEFKVKTAQVPEALKKQQEQLKACTTKLKELKKKVWQLSTPTWLAGLTDIDGIPFLALTLKDSFADELREIASELASTHEGLFFLMSPTPERTFVVIALSPSLAARLDMGAALAWLKSHGISGGGSKTMLQGSAAYLDNKLVEDFKTWVRQEKKS